MNQALTLPFLDTVVHLAWDKSKRHNSGDVHLRTEDVHVELKLVTGSLDVFETFLVVGASTTDPDLDLVLLEKSSDLTKSTDDTLEGGGDLEYTCQSWLRYGKG